MKKLPLLLSILFFAVCSLQAQNKFTGEIRYQSKIGGTDDPNLLSSVPTQIIDVSILGNKSKTLIKDENETYSITQVWDGDKGASTVVVEVMGMGKYYQKKTAEQVKEGFKLSDFSYKYENDFMEICGYKCQKVVAITTNLEDDSSVETIMYVTKEIGSIQLNGDQFPGLEGFPLMIITPLEQFCEECTMIMEAIKFSTKKIKDVDFLLPDDAKNIDDTPELKTMFGLE